MTDIVERLRSHVTSRGGLSKDADGSPVLPNGAWAMMLEAAGHIEELTKALEWQPISTAPRDGSWIVALCNDGTQIFHVYWQADQDSWYGHQGAYGDGLFAPHGGWMPAPAPRSAADLLASTISLEQSGSGK